MELLNIGYGNFINADRVVSIVSPDSAPIKRLVSDMRSDRQLIDATFGRRTRSVIFMNSSHIVLSALLPETLASRLDHLALTESHIGEE